MREGPRCDLQVDKEERISRLPKRRPKLVAVGNALAGVPPLRSVREALPHTAPTSGRAVPPPMAAVRTPVGSTRGTRHCVRHVAVRQTFPLVDLLPSTDSAAAMGPALFARFVSTTRSSDSSETCMLADGLGPSPTVPRPDGTWESPRSPGSRAWSFQACTGSLTPRRCWTARD
jgi:hypothetical protein